ncbi:MAG: hypothetical protein ABSD88_06085 [Candidatus Korobacteraceae bacterium]|jgi:hypothetical protein
MKRILVLLGTFVLAISLLPSARAVEKSATAGLKKFTGTVTKYDPATEITLAKKNQRLSCRMSEIPMKGKPKVGDVVSVTYEDVNGKHMCRSIVVEMYGTRPMRQGPMAGR